MKMGGGRFVQWRMRDRSKEYPPYQKEGGSAQSWESELAYVQPRQKQRPMTYFLKRLKKGIVALEKRWTLV